MMPMPPGPMGPPRMQPPMGPMGPMDLGMGIPQTPEGVMLWGNPVLDAPPVDLESMFPQETLPEMPLGMDPMMGGMGMPGMMAPPAPMDQEQVRQAAIAALQAKAQARLGASQGFQANVQNMGKPGY